MYTQQNVYSSHPIPCNPTLHPSQRGVVGPLHEWVSSLWRTRDGVGVGRVFVMGLPCVSHSFLNPGETNSFSTYSHLPTGLCVTEWLHSYRVIYVEFLFYQSFFYRPKIDLFSGNKGTYRSFYFPYLLSLNWCLLSRSPVYPLTSTL